MRTTLVTLLKSATLIALFATLSALSQLQLAPVYGTIPASASRLDIFGTPSYLVPLVTLCFLKLSSRGSPQPYRAAVAACLRIPLQDVLLRLGVRKLSISFAPMLTDICILLPVAIHLIKVVHNDLMSLKWHELLRIPHRLWTVLVAVSMGVCYLIMERYAFIHVPGICATSSTNRGVSRAGLQLQVAAVLIWVPPAQPRKFAVTLIASLAVIGLITGGATVPFRFLSAITGVTKHNALNHELHQLGWEVLARGESVTGYISVIENTRAQMRLMRCDHSILGGEWLLTEERREKEGWMVPEPVFGVFQMLEAVRLVEHEASTAFEGKREALVIGLGIGTAPKALIAHDISTTVVELDPLVHRYAVDYFGLPTNHTAMLSDAVPWVKELAATTVEQDVAVSQMESAKSTMKSQSYDYIIHDVFTGGASPLALFTLEFLSSLKTALNEHGVIAINYAGDITLKPMPNVLRTINVVFDGRCRAFRETAPTTQGTGEASADEGDMLNLVVFCVKAESMWPFSFKEPVESDYIGSKSRRRFLVPKRDLEIVLPDRDEKSVELVRDANVNSWKPQQLEAARRHWKLMRDMVPAVVWENW